MEIEFDNEKNNINIEKHGISLADAKYLEWETLVSSQDTRHDYGKNRMIGYALMGIRLHCIIYTDREYTRRVISLRKANKREVKQYANQN